MLNCRRGVPFAELLGRPTVLELERIGNDDEKAFLIGLILTCLLYTSDAADERSSVDLGGRRIIKKKNN